MLDLILPAVGAFAFLLAACGAAVDAGDRLRDRDPLAILSGVAAIVCGVAGFGAVDVVLAALGTTA